MAYEKISVQERIRALNLQQQAAGGGGSATASPRGPTWYASQSQQSPAMPFAMASSKPKSSVTSARHAPETSSRSLSISPPSEKAQLFKVAKVIQKSFNAEADIMNRSRPALALAEGRQRKKRQEQPQWHTRRQKSLPQAERDAQCRDQQQLERDDCVSGLNLSSQSEDSFELDTSAALSFSKTKGITSGGPMSYKEMLKKKRAIVATASPMSKCVAQNQGISPGASDVISATSKSIWHRAAAEAGGGEIKLLPPPEIVRTVNADSDIKESFEEENDMPDRTGHVLEEYKLEEDQHFVREQEEESHGHEQGGQGDAVHEQGVMRGIFEQHKQDDGNYFNYNQEGQEVKEQQEQQQENFDASADYESTEQSVEPSHKPPEKIGKEVNPSSHPHGSPEVSETAEHGHSQSKSVGGALGRTSYRAYARRSRLRTSPPAASALGVTSPELFAETMARDNRDESNAQSIASAGSASATSHALTPLQASSLSSRATRFLKDKKDKKDKRNQGERYSGVGVEVRGEMGKNDPDMARNIAQNKLPGRASKASIKQRAGASGTSGWYALHGQGERGAGLNLQLDSPFDEEALGKVKGADTAMGVSGKLQKIDLKPATMPKMNSGFSGINRDLGGKQHTQWQQQQYMQRKYQQQQYQQKPQHAGKGQQQPSHWQQQQQQQHAVMRQTAPATDTLRRDVPLSALLNQPYQNQAGFPIESFAAAQQQQQQLSESRDNTEKSMEGVEGGEYLFEQPPSLDSSSYSELKAQDLFDTSGNPPPQPPSPVGVEPVKAQGASSFLSSAHSEAVSILETVSHTDAFATFTRGEGNSFNNSCQVLEAINPLIDSTFNAIGSAAGPGRSASASNIFGSSNTVTRRVVPTMLCNNAPSDEDVAIEVEYVEQGEERSHTETDSVYSMSTRDMESD